VHLLVLLLLQPIVMHLACVLLRLTMVESLVAATINAAASLGKAASYGSIEVGKVADIVILDAPRYAMIFLTYCPTLILILALPGDCDALISRILVIG